MGLPRDPAAFAIRPAVRDDIPAIAALHVASWRESYAGLIDQRLIDERTVEARRAQWSAILDGPQRRTLVAHDRSALFGFASALILATPCDGYDSYLQLLYLSATAKGRGIGGALLRAIAASLLDEGCRSMVLRVLRRNPARAFYERFGARLAPDGLTIDAGLFDDVIYAFPDLHAIAQRSPSPTHSRSPA
jgi:GNAT superfamily N-acetyltransferase